MIKLPIIFYETIILYSDFASSLKILCVCFYISTYILSNYIFPFSGTKKPSILSNVNTTRQKYLTPKCRYFYRRVIEYSKKLTRLGGKFSQFKNRIAAAEKTQKSPEFQMIMDKVNSLTYKFLSQIRTQQQRPKARRFSTDEKLLALTFLKASGKGYRLLSKIFTLPSKKTLTNLLSKLPFTPGINTKIFECLKTAVDKMKKSDRLAILAFDEMAIESQLHYDSKQDCIIGLHNDYPSTRKPLIADYVNVFMLKGVFRQWKQPICYTFSSGPSKSNLLKNLIVEIIKESHNIGLEVVATVCDQGGPNQAAIKLLLEETKKECLRNNKINDYFGFLVNGKEVVPLFDTPHLFKGIRNNLLTKDLFFNMNGVDCVAKWKHIEQFYLLDIEEPLRVCPKLTDQHVMRHKINKMKVSCCTQVFSYQVGALMKRIVNWSKYF